MPRTPEMVIAIWSTISQLVWTENKGWFQDRGKLDNGWSYRKPENVVYIILTWFAMEDLITTSYYMAITQEGQQ